MSFRFFSTCSVVILIFSSCASVINSKYQKVTLHTGSNDAKIFIDNNNSQTGKVAVTKLRRDLNVVQVRVETPGYKPEYKTILQIRKSPWVIMSFVPFGVLLMYPPLMDKGSKSYDYSKEYTINPTVKISSKENGQKYVYLKQTSFEIKKENMVYEQLSYNQYVKKKKSKSVQTGQEEIDLPNSIFTESLNNILKKYGFSDSTKSIFRNRGNTMYLTSKVTKIKFTRVGSRYRKAGTYTYWRNGYVIAEVTATWDLQDIYDQSKYTKELTVKSGEFATNFDTEKREFDKAYIAKSIEDALTNSFSSFLADPTVKKLIDIEATKTAPQTVLKLNAPPLTASLKNAQASTVTVSSKDGHGSGCVISNDGLVVTNFHVIAGVKDGLTVTLNDGTKYPAKISRVNEDADLALLSIQSTGGSLAYYSLPAKQEFEMGDEVFAIGTPRSIELSQTISKGIISGLRKMPDNRVLIQTDVSTNAGNSGGALVSKQGQLYGIVNSKLVGLGVEGISFCIPAQDIKKLLSLE